MERRKHTRKKSIFTAELSVISHDYSSPTEEVNGGGFRADADVINISEGGLMLRMHKAPKDMFFSTTIPCFQKKPDFTGKQVTVHLSQPDMTVWGVVTRMDRESGQIAISLSVVSSIKTWKHLCLETLPPLSDL